MKKFISIFTISSIIFSISFNYSLPVLAASLDVVAQQLDSATDQSKDKNLGKVFNTESSSGSSSSGGGSSAVKNQRVSLQDLDLQISLDQASWAPVNGSFTQGFKIHTNPEVENYYLNVLDNSTNLNLLNKDYPFTLVSAPQNFASYYQDATTEVRAMATGQAPMFYFYVNTNNKLVLVNAADRSKSFQINGDWPAGNYQFSGRLQGENGLDTEEIIIAFDLDHDFNEDRENRAPVAAEDEYYIRSGEKLVVDRHQGILANDLDLDGPEELTVIRTNIVIGIDSEDLLHGKFALRADGTFAYQSVDSYVGPAYFYYKAFDGQNYSRATKVKINVAPAHSNHIPEAVSEEYSVQSGRPLVVSADGGILANDIDLDGPEDLTAIRTNIVIGTEPEDLLHGRFNFRADGSFAYQSVSDYVGPAYFYYKAFDGEDYSRATRVTINVTASGSNNDPVANTDSYQTNINTTLNVNVTSGVLANDVDPSSGPQTLTAVLSNNVSHGVLTLNSDGSFTYVPAGGFTGSDAFAYRAFDGQNYSDIATSTISVNAISGGGCSGCGGGGGGSTPYNQQVAINNNAAVTNASTVTLTLSANNMISAYAPLEMRISNFSDFNNAAWRPYATTTPWALLAGNGTRTVYAQFKNNRGTSAVGNDSIQVLVGQVLGSQEFGDAGLLLAQRGVKDATVYYIGQDGKKYAFPDPKTYYTWYDNFDKVIRVDVAELDLYLDGGVVTYRPGIKLVTNVNSNRVYAVEPNGFLKYISSEAMAVQLYGKNWRSLVQDVIPGYFASTYTKGSDIYDLLPTGTLAKEPDNDTVYYIENGKKRPFSSPSALRANYFRMKDVVIKTSLSMYSTGTSITNFERDLLPYPFAE